MEGMNLQDLTPQANLDAAKADVQQAQDLLTQGDQSVHGVDALSAYRQSVAKSEEAARIVQSITDVLQQVNPQAAGLHAAVSDEVASATSSVTDAGMTSDRATARSAAVAGLAAAQQTVIYGGQALLLEPARPTRVTLGATGVVVDPAWCGGRSFGLRLVEVEAGALTDRGGSGILVSLPSRVSAHVQ